MAKKITQLPTASLVKPSYYVPIVDRDDTQTEKATFDTVIAGLDGLIATLTGSNFSGPVIAAGGLSGSLTKLSSGISYLVAGANTFITTGSNGQVTITATGGSAAAGGSSGQLQYNNAAALDGINGTDFNGVRISFALPITASSGVNTSFVSASQGVSGSQIQVGGSDPYVSINTTGTSNSSVGWFRFPYQNGTIMGMRNASNTADWNVIQLIGGSHLKLGIGEEGGGTVTVQAYDVNLSSVNSGGSVSATVDSVEGARFTKTRATISLPFTASYGISGSNGTFGVGELTSSFDSTVAQFNVPVTASIGLSASFWNHGGSPASDGTLRFSLGDSWRARSLTTANDLSIIETDASHNIFFGTNTGYTDNKQFSGINMYSYSGGVIYFGNGTTTRIRLSSAGVTLYTPGDPLTFGYTGAASTGLLRWPNNQWAYYRNAADTADYPIFGANSSNELMIGTDAAYSVQAPNIRAYAASNGYVYLGYGGTSAFYVGGGSAVSSVPLTASAVSASYFNLNGSGNNKPNTGMLRVSYNMGNIDKVITAKYSDDLTDNDFLTYGAGNLWTIGNVNANTNINAYSMQLVSQAGGFSLYHNSAMYVYNYGRTAYDFQVNNTGFNLMTKPGGQMVDRTTIGHRLTLSSSNPIYSGSIISASTLYLTPYTSNQIALYNNTDWYLYTTDEISLSLTSSLAIDKNYDVFATPDSTSPSGVSILLGPAWTTGSVRSTPLDRRDGVLVLSSSHARRYLGTIRTTSATTTEDSESKRLVYNYYNQVERHLYVEDQTASWTYSVAAWRQVRASSANKVEAVFGVVTKVDGSSFIMWNAAGGTGIALYTGIGINTSAVNSAKCTTMLMPTAPAQYWWPSSSVFDADMPEGYYAFNWLEYSHAVGITGLGLAGFSQSHLRLRVKM